MKSSKVRTKNPGIGSQRYGTTKGEQKQLFLFNKIRATTRSRKSKIVKTFTQGYSLLAVLFVLLFMSSDVYWARTTTRHQTRVHQLLEKLLKFRALSEKFTRRLDPRVYLKVLRAAALQIVVRYSVPGPYVDTFDAVCVLR